MFCNFFINSEVECEMEDILLNDDCIICLDNNNTIDNRLCKGNEIYNCNCSYYVHKNCIEEWIKYKNNIVCIHCNKQTQLIQHLNTSDEVRNIYLKLLKITFFIFCILITMISLYKEIKIDKNNKDGLE